MDFEEQTKDYENILEDFYLGDYIDRGNRNYFYDFEHECPECHATNEIHIAIRHGQYVGVYVGEESSEVEVTELENIEDGYERNRMYDRLCERKLGYDNSVRIDHPLEQRHVGDHITALRTDWEILEVYHVEAVDNEKYNFFLQKWKENYVYRVVSGEDKRIISERVNNFISELVVQVMMDESHPEECRSNTYDEERFAVSEGERLIRIE